MSVSEGGVGVREFPALRAQGGHTFLLEKPPVPPKPKLKSPLGKGPVTFRDPLLKQSSDSELMAQQHHAATAGLAMATQRGDVTLDRNGHCVLANG